MITFTIHEECQSYMKYIVEAKDEDEALKKHLNGDSNFIRQNYGDVEYEVEVGDN